MFKRQPICEGFSLATMPTTPSPGTNGKKTNHSLYITMPKISILDSVRSHTSIHTPHVCQAAQSLSTPPPGSHCPHWHCWSAARPLNKICGSPWAGADPQDQWSCLGNNLGHHLGKKENPQTKSIRWHHFQVSQKTEDDICLEES